VIKTVGQGNQSDFRREIVEQLRRQNSWISDAQHKIMLHKQDRFAMRFFPNTRNRDAAIEEE
jgi:hypothetical protein